MKTLTSLIQKLTLLSLMLWLGNVAQAQVTSVSISGQVKHKSNTTVLPYANIILKTAKDSAFVTGTVSNEEGRFTLTNVKPNDYILTVSLVGFNVAKQKVFVGKLSAFLDLPVIELTENIQTLGEITVQGKADEVSAKMDKKVFSIANNISQSGGSILQAMQSVPGVTIESGKVSLRGNDKVTILIDGKQTALTGFNAQYGLDNIPASNIDKIEVINNPSSKYDANGSAGIINIIMKKNIKQGFNGKLGLATGLGALWQRQDNYPDVRPQYTMTPKINPSLALNYRTNKINAFVQVDNLYTHTLNKNEYTTRTYDDGAVIKQQQLKRNRDTNFFNSKAGFDWFLDNQNTLTVSGLFGTEKILDNGDEPFFNGDFSQRLRLWTFLEDELKTTAMATLAYQHKFKDPGHLLNFGYNYTFHREDEKYFFTNAMPTFTGKDSFKLLSDETVSDFNLDYIKPLKFGRVETGVKYRKRDIPTNMQFFPGVNSPLDSSAGGPATYKESIPAVYGNLVFETRKLEAEIGLRMEYVSVNYQVSPTHNTYKSDGYSYTQPFPNVRLGYKISDNHQLTFLYNRRVDRPNEVDIRVFPKYDDAEIIKVGNPALKPQFTNSLELGYKTSIPQGYFYTSLYHKIVDGTITRISSTVPNSTLIYAIFQNVNKSYNTGIEMVFSKEIAPWYSLNVNANVYRNQINAFAIMNLYPTPHISSSDEQMLVSWNTKWNNIIHLPNKTDLQVLFTYLAPDLIPQGRIQQRFSCDVGLKKSLSNGKHELVVNATDLFNTMKIKKTVNGDGFKYTSADYYETQVIRVGYNYKF